MGYLGGTPEGQVPKQQGKGWSFVRMECCTRDACGEGEGMTLAQQGYGEVPHILALV